MKVMVRFLCLLEAVIVSSQTLKYQTYTSVSKLAEDGPNSLLITRDDTWSIDIELNDYSQTYRITQTRKGQLLKIKLNRE